MAEIAKFDMLAVGELSAGPRPKEMIQSEAQEILELKAVTDSGASYGRAADQINRYQHRRPGSEVSSRQLDYLATRKRKAVFDMQNKIADTILEGAGINPRTLKPEKNGVLSSIIRLPEAEDNARKTERFWKLIEVFKEDREGYAQIRNEEFILKTKCSYADTVIVCMDQISVKHQCELKCVKGKKPEGTANSSEWVENTLIHIQAGGNVY